MMNWSSGALEATSTAADALCLRPARPARCHVDAIVPGYPAITTASSDPMSMPSSSAFVATTPRISPSRKRRSISRRSRGRYPARYPRMLSSGTGPRPQASRRYVSRISVARRLLANTSVCWPRLISSTASRRVSLM